MSEQVTTATTENTNQVATEENKTAATATTTATETAATAAVTTEVKTDAATTTTTEAPKADDKNPPAVQAVVFELKKADGSLLTAPEAEKIVSFSKEHGLSPAQAQAIYNRENAASTAFEADVAEQYNQRKNEWIETGKKDPVLGGEHYAQNIQAAHLAFQKFSTPEFTKLLDETGFGHHPELLKVFFNIHKANQDDTLVRAGDTAQVLKPTSDVMYDKTNK